MYNKECVRINAYRIGKVRTVNFIGRKCCTNTSVNSIQGYQGLEQNMQLG